MKYTAIITMAVLALVAFLLIIVLKEIAQDEEEYFITEEIKSKVIAIREGYKSRPERRKMELESGQSFTIPKAMRDILQIGDSVYKTKGENFYIFVDSKTKERKKVNIR